MNGLAYLGAVGVTSRLARLLLQFSLAILLSNTTIALAQNRVLELDGNGSYVELPPDVFKDLTQATVEGWVKWDSFRNWSRFFDFGEYGSAMTVANVEATDVLAFVFCQPPNMLFHQVR